MRLSTLSKALLLLVLCSPLSCNTNESIESNGTGINIPSYVSVQNAFSYSITAMHLTDVQTIPLSFTRIRLQIAVAIPNGVEGRAIFSLIDASSTVIHADTFQRAGMYRVFAAPDVPVLISIQFLDFSGSIHYVLVGDTLVSEYFPNGRGSQWRYFVYDSLVQQSDTLAVTVFGHATLPGDIPTTIWQLAYRSRIETLYVSTVQDTVRFYRYPASTWENFNYVLPLYVGSSWYLSFASSMVLRVDSVITPANALLSAFVVQSQWNGPNDRQTLESWFVPYVGIVKVRRKGISFGLANTTWELLSYRVQ